MPEIRTGMTMGAMVAHRFLLFLTGVVLMSADIGSAQESVMPGRVLFQRGDGEGREVISFDDSAWQEVAPSDLSRGWQGLPGGPSRVGSVGWYRIHFAKPFEAEAKAWMVSAGFVGNLSKAYWNGQPIGEIGGDVGGTILVPPQRTVHAWAVAANTFRKAGEGDNVLAIRVRNVAGAGGILGGPVGLYPVDDLLGQRRFLELGREAVVFAVAAFALVWALVFVLVRATGDATQPWLFAASLFAATGTVHLMTSQLIFSGEMPGGAGWVVGLAVFFYWAMPILTPWMIRGLCEGRGWKREMVVTLLGLGLVVSAHFLQLRFQGVILLYLLMLLGVGVVSLSRAWQGWRTGSVAAPAVLLGLVFLCLTVSAQVSLFVIPWMKLAASVWQPMDLGILAAVTSVGGTLLRRYALARRREQRLAREVLESGRRERTRVGRHLHDGVAQDLQYLMLAAKRLRKEQPESLAAEEMVNGLGEAIGEVRRAAEDLQPLALRGATLKEALETLAAKLSVRHGVEVEVGIEKIPELTDSEKDAIFRAAQEAAGNACRHAQATSVKITVSSEDGEIVTRVTDDGQGFDPHGLSSERMGLKFLRDQAELSGGKLDIDSKPGSGTRIHYRLPLSRRDNFQAPD
ncbi:MAG: sensor histidine kinase [Verrucomicrobiae bacterium]|nr:sensor histidine kinase [Verrucomicrobiae bacterium]